MIKSCVVAGALISACGWFCVCRPVDGFASVGLSMVLRPLCFILALQPVMAALQLRRDLCLHLSCPDDEVRRG
jgi:hypothetical protein